MPTIRTNRHLRPFRYREEVPASVLADYFEWTEAADGFFCYRGIWYHLSQFEHVAPGGTFGGWHGVYFDGFTSGVLVQVSTDGESYRAATFY